VRGDAGGGSARLLVDAFSGMGLNLSALAPDYWAGSRRIGPMVSKQKQQWRDEMWLVLVVALVVVAPLSMIIAALEAKPTSSHEPYAGL
jgi:hypothetical protein